MSRTVSEIALKGEPVVVNLMQPTAKLAASRLTDTEVDALRRRKLAIAAYVHAELAKRLGGQGL